MAISNPQTDYEIVQAQIQERKLALKRNGFPERMYALWRTLRSYQRPIGNGLDKPFHPLLEEMNAFSSGLVNFIFNGRNYEIDFHEGSPSYGNVSGTLTIRLGREEVMKSSFNAVHGEYGTETFNYSDSSVFKQGSWADDLDRFQREDFSRREAARKHDREGPATLAALRAQFGIPTPPPPLQPQSSTVTSFWRRIFPR